MNLAITTARGTVITFNDRFNPQLGERTGPAWEKIMEKLEDCEWHLWRDIVSTVQPGSGLLAKTVSNLLHCGVATGRLRKRGKYSPNPARDTRSIQLTTKGTS